MCFQIEAMKRLSCKYLVKLKRVLRSPKKIYIVMECVGGGALLDHLVDYGKMSEDTSREYFVQIVNGVKVCHSRNIFHRDLKPDNILLTEDLLTAKVGDFGLAALVIDNSDAWRKTRCGSELYAAPEVFFEEEYHPGPADIWGLGTILYCMISGFPPFQDKDPITLFEKVQNAKVKYPPWISADAKDLLKNIFQRDPDDRFTLEEILEHPWCREVSQSFQVIPTSPVHRFLKHSGFTPVDVDDEEDESEQNGIPSANAFTLIAMSGSFDLTRLFEVNDKTFTRMSPRYFLRRKLTLYS